LDHCSTDGALRFRSRESGKISIVEGGKEEKRGEKEKKKKRKKKKGGREK